MSERITVRQALRRGFFWVNGPVLLIMFIPFALFVAVFKWTAYLQSHLSPEAFSALNMVCLVFAPLGLPAAWLWWSVTIPKWKLWAYNRVDDLWALKIAAVRAGLIWPDGNIFAKTEICSKSVRQQIRILEEAAGPAPQE